MDIKKYERELKNRELAESTIEMYLRAVRDLLDYAAGQELTHDLLIDYKKVMMEKYKTSTLNNKITMINNFLDFIGKEMSLKQERTQRSNVLDDVLNQNEYERIRDMATRRGKHRTRAVIQILYYTGVRVSEIKFITVEALKRGYIDIDNKGKHRRVAISKTLESELKEFIKSEGITEGQIIRNSRGEPLSRSQIFRGLKWVGGQARIKKDKVYPHSFRHLFAKQWLANNGDNVLGLADILGHSSIETTRIYTTLSTDEQRDTINF